MRNSSVQAKAGGSCGNANANGGWTQGGMNAALLGLAAEAAADVVGRARCGNFDIISGTSTLFW